MAETRPDRRGVALVAVGGFVGANLRHLGAVLVSSSLVGTAAVNVVGCLALGFLVALDRDGRGITRSQTALLGTGLLGSFTTYSTFALDALGARPATAAAYVAGSYALGFGAVLLGGAGARTIAGEES